MLGTNKTFMTKAFVSALVLLSALQTNGINARENGNKNTNENPSQNQSPTVAASELLYKNKIDTLVISEQNNPGNLSAQLIINQSAQPLLVLLHGCTQSSIDFANHSGFMKQASKYNINLLLIEQSSQNNPQKCFNWFSEQDTRLGMGENQSIINYIAAAKTKVDASRVFIVGLSAGGAMANAVFSQAPNLFDGLAVMSGIPYPCANTLTQAISCMKSGSQRSPEELASQISTTYTAINMQSSKNIVVATGNEDVVVHPDNATSTAMQYVFAKQLSQSDLSASAISKASFDSIDKTIWQARNEQTSKEVNGNIEIENTNKVQLLTFKGINHGWPVGPSDKNASSLHPYFLESEVSLTKLILEEWF